MFEYEGDMIDCPKCLYQHPPHVQCRPACLPQKPAGRPGCLPPGTEIHLPSAVVSVIDGVLSVSECLSCGFKPMRRGRTLCVNCEKERTVKPSSVSMMAREEARPTAGGQLLRVEKWKSSENREEVHYFIEGSQVYVMGHNLALVPEDVVIRALKGLGYKV